MKSIKTFAPLFAMAAVLFASIVYMNTVVWQGMQRGETRKIASDGDVSMIFAGADVRDVFRTIFTQSGNSKYVSDSLKAKGISAHLENQSWMDAAWVVARVSDNFVYKTLDGKIVVKRACPKEEFDDIKLITDLNEKGLKEKINLSFEKADFREIVAAIATQGNVNIVYSIEETSDLDKEGYTMKQDDVTARNAILALAAMSGREAYRYNGIVYFLKK